MSEHNLVLLFADGVSHRIRVPHGEPVLEATAREGLTLLTDCNNGQCGTCVAELCSGQVALDGYDSAVLSDDDRATGSILPCVTRVAGDCAIELPYDYAEACQDEPEPVRGVLTAVARVADETVRLEVDVQEGVVFEAGQYVRIRPLGSDDWRSYSMANASGSTRLVFYIRLVPGGVFSDWLVNQAAPGAEFELSAPRGSFFLRHEARPRLFVAGGTGLAPFIAMLTDIEADATERELPTTLLMGVRTADHLFAREQVQALQNQMPGLDVLIASETGGIDGAHHGYPTDLIPGLRLEPKTRVYLCGPPPMVDAGRSACAGLGISRSDVICERFA